ncbi:MAG: hypothetical protein GX418_00265 [Clostridiales bacterium]|nr:hypothetical protein [Clostridiales bacterium]
MKSEFHVSLQDTPREFPKRIVFQLDMSLDTLHYRIWTAAGNGEGTTGTIREFRKALHQCRLVHPDDIGACDRALEAQAGMLNVSTLDIRLTIGSTNYSWYRLFTVMPENPQGGMRTVSGVLEALQGGRGGGRRNGERFQQDTLFRRAVTCSSVLSLGFCCTTGERLVSDTDVLPWWLPENVRLKDVVNVLREQPLFAENKNREADSLLAENALTHCLALKPFFRDCRLFDLTRKTESIRWYRVYHAFIREALTSPVCFYLTIVDIDEEKHQEQLLEESLTLDRTTGMLKRCAFENRVTEWLECARNEAGYHHICSVVIVIDHAIDMEARQGREDVLKKVLALSKTIRAFIHPHELCGRYGFARFAMALSGSTAEIIHERLKMLGMVLHSLNTEWVDLQVRYGCNVEPASQTEQGDVFLEKANQSLPHEASGTLLRMVQPAANANTPAACLGNAAVAGCNAQETPANGGKHNIFIRTFGHFDVFVDGEAVLFHHSKAKELLALLVDRRGGFVGATEAISCLWEDEPANSTTLSRCRKAAMHLRETLCKYGIECLMETVSGKRRIRVGSCDCDYYQYLQHATDGSHKILYSYMSEYSWAENTVAHEQ